MQPINASHAVQPSHSSLSLTLALHIEPPYLRTFQLSVSSLIRPSLFTSTSIQIAVDIPMANSLQTDRRIIWFKCNVTRNGCEWEAISTIAVVCDKGIECRISWRRSVCEWDVGVHVDYGVTVMDRCAVTHCRFSYIEIRWNRLKRDSPTTTGYHEVQLLSPKKWKKTVTKHLEKLHLSTIHKNEIFSSCHQGVS